MDETLRIIKAFKYADEHEGQVCPANWQPGDATISADQDDKLKFFQTLYNDKK